MGNQKIQQAVVVRGGTREAGVVPVQLQLFDSTGAPVSAYKQMPFQADSTAADLTAMKADFNALLAKMRASGQMAAS